MTKLQLSWFFTNLLHLVIFLDLDFLGIIPARYASTRFPGKPLADLGGKPLIQRVYENAAREIGNLVVATDHEGILEAVKKFGGRAMMTSARHPSGTDRCNEVVSVLAASGETFDVILNIQGDEPFIDPAYLQELKGMFRNPETGIATLACPVSDPGDLQDPNVVKLVCDADGIILYFSRQAIPFQRDNPEARWLLKYPYLRHFGVYAYRPGILSKIAALDPSPLEIAESLEQLRWLENGFRIRAGIVKQASPGIDTPEDLELARKQLE